MTRQLVLIHGRAQEHKDSVALKAEWLDALSEGLAKSNLKLPITEDDVRFPFYGDTLYDLVGGKPSDIAADIIVRGLESDNEEQQFAGEFIAEVQQRTGVSDEQLRQLAGDDVIRRGPLNWEWVQTFLKAVDRFVPFGSGAGISLFTHDVFVYLTNKLVREKINAGVSAAIAPDRETVVVGHSLGSVVAYNVLQEMGSRTIVPLFVTVGAPLAVTAVKARLKRMGDIRCPECVSEWFNAMDERDCVALYPLSSQYFPLNPVNPAITNKLDVSNKTRNRHGIAGYLDDKEVAQRIYDALI